jgi:HAD superfamily hydrolase (TIGR01450 family)
LCCDLDGVIWLGEQPIAGSAAAIARLREAGFRVVFVTNNSSATRADYVEKLRRCGVQSESSDIVSSATAAAQWCARELGTEARVLLHAGPGVREALVAFGFTSLVDADDAQLVDRFDVVVCGWHRNFDFARLSVAANALHHGARFVATNLDPTYPDAAGRVPGNGALVAAVAAAGGRAPDIVAGKPHAPMVDVVTSAFGTTGIMIGDRPSTDGDFAAALGWPFALVLSGVAGLAGEEPIPTPAPAYVAPDLARLVDQLI